MKQISLFGDEFFEEPASSKKENAGTETKLLETPENLTINEEPIAPTFTKEKEIQIEAEVEISETRALPSDLEQPFSTDEKLLEENYVREDFIFSDPEPEYRESRSRETESQNKKLELPKPPKQITEPAPRKGRGRMKLSEMEVQAEMLNIPEDLFQKRYYSIGSVAEMFNVNISLLRYWENEFDILKPKKNGKGDRHFRPEDIKNIQMIYHLLREKKYTLQGAKDFLKKNRNADKHFEVIESLKNLKSFLLELKSTI